MDRRTFIGSVAGGVLTVSLVARAQKSPIPLIGFLSSASPAPFVAAFSKGLNETGYVEGKNVAIEFRWAEGQYDRLPALAAELVRRQVAVLVATGGPRAALAAKAATSTIPIVFTTGSDPVEFGLVASLGHPGGNATGVTIFTVDLVAKRMELLRQLVPKATIIAFISNPNTPYAESEAGKAQETARSFGQHLHVLRAGTAEEIDAAFATLVQLRAGALLIGSDPFFGARREQFVALAARHAVPAIFDLREFVTAGGACKVTEAAYPKPIARPASIPARSSTAPSPPICQSCSQRSSSWSSTSRPPRRSA